MKNSIAFIITRMNWYRFFSPVIDRAMSNGWHVECWHDVSRLYENNPEDFPDKNEAPLYSSGIPLIREFQNIDTVYNWIKERKVDAVVDTRLPTCRFCAICSDSKTRSLFVCLNANADWFQSVNNASQIDSVDIFALNTVFWLDESFEIIRRRNTNWWNESLQEQISSKTTFVGWPQIDQLSSISQDEVRREYGIPLEKPVVVYFNWVDSHLLNLRQRMFSSLKLKHKAWAILRDFKEVPSYWKHIFEPNLEQITKAVRRFCDNNDAFLIVKHRYRDKPFECERQIADLVVSDESYYPHSIFKVLSVASLSLGYFSFAVRESIACKVPFISMDVCGLADRKSWGESGESFYRLWSNTSGPFNYKGIVSVLKANDFIKSFEDKSLSDFVFQDKIYNKYEEKYLAGSRTSNSDLLLDAIKRVIDSKE